MMILFHRVWLAAQVAEMKNLLVSSLSDMKMEIQNLKSDVYAKKKRKVMHIHIIICFHML